jgi:hypothetical protein
MVVTVNPFPLAGPPALRTDQGPIAPQSGPQAASGCAAQCPGKARGAIRRRFIGTLVGWWQARYRDKF